MKIEKFLSTITVCSTLVGVFWYGITNYLQFKRDELKTKAIEACMSAATIETSYQVGETNAIRTEPIHDLYLECLKDKGY